MAWWRALLAWLSLPSRVRVWRLRPVPGDVVVLELPDDYEPGPSAWLEGLRRLFPANPVVVLTPGVRASVESGGLAGHRLAGHLPVMTRVLTVDAWRAVEHFTGIRLRVCVDGEDVTRRCFAADPRYGWAAVYTLDEAGWHHIEPGTHRPAVELLLGDVVLVRAADPTWEAEPHA